MTALVRTTASQTAGGFKFTRAMLREVQGHRAKSNAMRERKGPMPVALRRLSKFERIVAKISWATGVSVAEIRGKARSREIVFARQAVMYWALRLLKVSTTTVGRQLGGRDHTTVVHGRRTYVRKRLAMGRKLKVIGKP